MLVVRVKEGVRMNYAKIRIKGTIESLTGMHIGGADRFSAIGSIDSYVVRDIVTDDPMIPGSSFKGKMRSLLAKVYNQKTDIKKHDDDDEKLLKLFGNTKGNDKVGRLVFSDMFLINKDYLSERKVATTEVKAENTINRLTAEANPRFIERSVKGAKYGLDIVYTIDDKVSAEDLERDFTLIKEGLTLLELNYLGGNGSRGYGKVKFDDLVAEVAYGELGSDLLQRINDILNGVSK